MRYKYEYQHCTGFNHNKSFISSQDLSELMASVTNGPVGPPNFALASLDQLSFVRSAAVSMSVSHSWNLVESYSLKTAMSCSNGFVRFVSFCIVHKVFVYYHITSLKGSVGVGGGGGWSDIERFCSLHAMQSKVSAAFPSPASTHWPKLFISLVSTVSLLWMLYTGSLGWLSASGPPRSTVALELWVLSLSISVGSGCSACEMDASVQGASCASVAGNHSLHFICGAISLIFVSDLPKHGLEWWMHSCTVTSWHVEWYSDYNMVESLTRQERW